MQYAQLFRRLREQKGLSHEALAKLARCHRNTVINAEGERGVRFKTLANLMGKMGYPSTSPEMASMALLWLESVSGIDLADPSSLNQTRQKLAVYDRSAGHALQLLSETVKKAKLSDREIRLLAYAAQHSEMLAIIESIQTLMHATDAPSLKVAEDK
jgi:transcriptional regulator with XRE-family HTH domain